MASCNNRVPDVAKNVMNCGGSIDFCNYDNTVNPFNNQLKVSVGKEIP